MLYKRITAFIFALYPILVIYQSPLPFVWGDLLLFLLALYGIIRYKYFSKLSTTFFFLWGYVAITNIINSIGQLSITTFVPGGIMFFMFAITYLFLCDALDYEKYKKCYKSIAIICVLFWAVQEFIYLFFGTRVSGLIPFMDVAGDVSVTNLIAIQQLGERSCSFFKEPAHFVQFLLPILCIDLFEVRGKKNISSFSWILIACMVLSRSGNALVGLAVILLFKFYYMFKRTDKRFINALFIILFVTIGVYYYMNSEMGMSMLARMDEFDREQSSGFLRVVRGFIIYSELPLINQLAGINFDVLESYLPKMSLFDFTGNTNEDLYVNGFQNILLRSGFFGVLFYLFFFISIYRKTTDTGRSIIMLTFALSLIANIYLAYPMMICMVVSTIEMKLKNNDVNNINSLKK